MKSAIRVGLLMALAGWVVCSCESRIGWEGRYVSHQNGGSPPISLTLQADGKGLWMIDQESTPLRWEMRQGAIWLHIRTGGVLIARIQSDQRAITVDLPDGGSVLLSKSSSP